MGAHRNPPSEIEGRRWHWASGTLDVSHLQQGELFLLFALSASIAGLALGVTGGQAQQIHSTIHAEPGFAVQGFKRASPFEFQVEEGEVVPPDLAAEADAVCAMLQCVLMEMNGDLRVEVRGFADHDRIKNGRRSTHLDPDEILEEILSHGPAEATKRVTAKSGAKLPTDAWATSNLELGAMRAASVAWHLANCDGPRIPCPLPACEASELPTTAAAVPGCWETTVLSAGSLRLHADAEFEGGGYGPYEREKWRSVDVRLTRRDASPKTGGGAGVGDALQTCWCRHGSAVTGARRVAWNTAFKDCAEP